MLLIKRNSLKYIVVIYAAVCFIGCAATQSAQAQPDTNITTKSTQTYSTQADAKRKLVMKFYEAFNTGNTALLDKALAYDWLDHPTAPGQGPGLAGFKPVVVYFRTAFPDLHATVEDVVIQGDKVVVRTIIRGTQQGEFLSVPATGRPVTFMAIDIHRIANNRIVETWHVEELLSVVQQLGATVTPPIVQR